MKRCLRLGLILVGLGLGLGAGGLAFWLSTLPKVDAAPSIAVQPSPERVARGRYLAHHVAVCMDCHSQRDWSRFSGPIVPGSEGQGGEKFDPAMGFPGTYVASNLTPAHLSGWTDGEILRAMTAGVSRDNRPLFPVMPYLYYGRMSEDDAVAIVAYLRTLPAKQNAVAASQPAFPMQYILKMIPRNAQFTAKPEASDQVKYGEYLTNMAGCVECHTQDKQGQIIPGREFAGGRVFPMPYGRVVSSNITPDEQTGIGIWTEAFFLARFEAAAASARNPSATGQAAFNTPMPWSQYAGMTREDLQAIFAYLRTRQAIHHLVKR